MRRSHLIGLRVLAVAVAAAILVPHGGERTAVARPALPRYAERPMPAALRDATFRFDPAIAPLDRQAILGAIASARPEARALIADVDGLTTLRVGSLSYASGVTRTTPAGYDVTLDLGPVARQLGPRGIRRLVLHELGHVVDFALVPGALQTSLDAGVPRGWGCDDGHSGACATRPERFAESFAKWAMNDIGVDLFIGYRVPPPEPSLDAWGTPLAALATRP